MHVVKAASIETLETAKTAPANNISPIEIPWWRHKGFPCVYLDASALIIIYALIITLFCVRDVSYCSLASIFSTCELFSAFYAAILTVKATDFFRGNHSKGCKVQSRYYSSLTQLQATDPRNIYPMWMVLTVLVKGGWWKWCLWKYSLIMRCIHWCLPLISGNGPLITCHRIAK